MQAESWISEKLQTASDESYRDPTNLQSKLQKHQAFEAELSANKGRVDSVRQVGHTATLQWLCEECLLCPDWGGAD